MEVLQNATGILDTRHLAPGSTFAARYLLRAEPRGISLATQGCEHADGNLR
jgi:hypothetical protein